MTYNQFRLLLGYDRSRAVQALGKKFQAAMWRDHVDDLTPLQVLTKLEQADPTRNKQYMQWLIRAFQNGSKFEDLLSRGKQNLTKFNELTKHKELSAADRDISKFVNLTDLEDRMDAYEDVRPKVVDKGQYEEVLNNSEMRVIKLGDKQAACYYGQGTRWCTAADQNNMFGYYHSKDRALYVIIPKHPKYPGEKFQWHFGTNQYMDDKDEKINLEEFRKRFPKKFLLSFRA